MRHTLVFPAANRLPVRVVFALACLWSCSVRAEPIVLDQSAETLNGHAGPAIGNASPAYVCQTFTAGVGGRLSRIGVQIYKDLGATGDVFLEVHPTVGGVPQAAVLATATIANADIPLELPPESEDPLPVTIVDVSAAAIDLSPGDVLAVGLWRNASQPGMPPWMIWTDAVDYPGGELYRYAYDAGAWGYTPTGWPDCAFQTFVAVPEPSSLALGGAAFLGTVVLGLRRRPNRRERALAPSRPG